MYVVLRYLGRVRVRVGVRVRVTVRVRVSPNPTQAWYQPARSVREVRAGLMMTTSPVRQTSRAKTTGPCIGLGLELGLGLGLGFGLGLG